MSNKIYQPKLSMCAVCKHIKKDCSEFVFSKMQMIDWSLLDDFDN